MLTRNRFGLAAPGLVALLALALPACADGIFNPGSSSGGGSSSIISGTTPCTGCASGGVLFSDGTKVQSSSLAVTDVALVSPPILCNGTDQTSNLNTLLAALQTAGTGGILGFHACTYLFTPGAAGLVLPNNGASPPTQATFVFQGAGGYVSGRGAAGIGGTIFDIRSSNALGHIQTYGLGSFSIRDIQFTDGGSSSGNPFLYTTNTSIYPENNAFIGSPDRTGSTANQDAIVLGGTSTANDGTTNAAFQGYGTNINTNYFDRVRRVAYCRVFCNGVTIQNNLVWSNSGNPLQGAKTVTSVAGGGSGYVIGDQIILAGGTSSPPAVLTVLTLSGSAVATVSIRQQGSYTANPSNPVAQLSTSGVGTGATFNLTFGVTGAAIEVDGTGAGGAPGNYAVGNNILNNTIEVTNYAYGVNLLFSEFTNIQGNNYFDNVITLACVYADGDSLATFILGGLCNGIPSVLGAATNVNVAMLSLNNGTPSLFPYGMGCTGCTLQVTGVINASSDIFGGNIHSTGTYFGEFLQDKVVTGPYINLEATELDILTRAGAKAISITNAGAGAVGIAGALTIGAGSAITSSGAGGALGSNAFTSTAYAPLASPTFTGAVTFNGSIAASIRTVTGAGAITVSATTDYFICVNKTSGAATTVNLPATPATGLTYLIKDCKGDAATNNITITPAAGNIDNAGTYVLSVNLGSVAVTYNGTGWFVN